MTPEKLGRYEILGELGKGAMGVVFLARDPIIGREVALKTFHIGFSAKDKELDQFRARFLREAQSAGILNHPNIVTIHDVVEDERGAFFIAMEYVKGTDLKQLIQRRTRLDLRFVVELVAQVADGLAYAHQKGVVHRDIKPANVIITADKQAKITDFGIARMETSNLTMEGQLLGTPNYMAPEQIRGKEVDHRADLFSLGVMLYELLTGRKPFHGENLTVVTHRIVYDAFTPPAELVPNLPPGLQEVLEKALQKAPGERYQRGADLARELRAALEPVRAVRPAGASGGSFLTDTSTGRSVLPAAASEEGAPAAAAPNGQATGATFAAPPPAAVGPSPPPPPSVTATPPAGWGERLGKPPLWRLVTVALLALALPLLLGRLAFGRFDQETTVEQPRLGYEEQLRYLPDLKRGQALLAEDRPGEALEAIERALAIAPADRHLQQLRGRAERELLDLEGSDYELALISRRLAAAEAALNARRYREASLLATEILEIDPDHQPAKALQSQANDGLERRRRAQVRLSGGRDRLATEGAGTAQRVQPSPAVTASSVVGTAQVEVRFHSDISEGILTIYAGKRTVLKNQFRYVEKRGLLRNRKTSGGFSETLTLQSGPFKLNVYAWRKVGKETSTEVTEVRGELAEGASAVLNLKLTKAGDLEARLD